jgi:hypothetical protein
MADVVAVPLAPATTQNVLTKLRSTDIAMSVSKPTN